MSMDLFLTVIFFNAGYLKINEFISVVGAPAKKLKKGRHYQEEVSIDFILFFYFIPICGTRSSSIFIADDC